MSMDLRAYRASGFPASAPFSLPRYKAQRAPEPDSTLDAVRWCFLVGYRLNRRRHVGALLRLNRRFWGRPSIGPGAPHAGADAHDSLLVERNRDVDHRLVKIVDEDSLPGQQIHPIEAGHTTHDQRREATIVEGHVLPADPCRCRTRPACRDRRSAAGGHERTRIRRRLDCHLVQRRIDVEQRRSRVRVEIIIRVGGPGDTERSGCVDRCRIVQQPS